MRRVAVLPGAGRRLSHFLTWFERSLFVYGWNAGVVAASVTLLRVVDPRPRTQTLEDYGLAYVFICGIKIVLLVELPVGEVHAPQHLACLGSFRPPALSFLYMTHPLAPARFRE